MIIGGSFILHSSLTLTAIPGEADTSEEPPAGGVFTASPAALGLGPRGGREEGAG